MLGNSKILNYLCHYLPCFSYIYPAENLSMILTDNSDGEVELKKIDDITNVEATEEEVVFLLHQEVEALKDEDVKDDEDSNEIFDNDTSITTTSTLKSINLADQELVHPGM